MPDVTQPALPEAAAAARAEAPRLLREATISLVRRVPPKVREDETADEVAAREAQATDEVEIAISSEIPVPRVEYIGWDSRREFDEILLHGPENIDLAYARDGLPLFVGHWGGDMAGLAEGVRVDEDRVMRARPVRFSSSQLGRDIKQDMIDGIRKKVSVGYDYGPDDYTEEKKGDRIVRTVHRWRPMEVSSVPIPADYDVGVGRSAPPGARGPLVHPGTTAPKAKEIRVADTPAAPSGATNQPNDAAEIAARGAEHGLGDRVAGWLKDGRTLSQVQAEILEFHKERTKKLTAAGGDGGVVTLTDKEERQYSLLRAIRSAASGNVDGFEGEIHAEISKALGRDAKSERSVFVPTNLRSPGGKGIKMRAGNYAGTTGAGAELVFTQYGGFIPALRNRALIFKMGARLLSGLRDNVGFVSQTSANTLTWGAETGSATATNFGTSLRTMTPKNAWAATQFSRQMLAQSSEDVEALAWDDILKVVALGLDLAAISGPGTASQPTGILSTTGIGAVTLGTAGGAPTYEMCVDLETEITDDNADISAMGYIFTPRGAAKLKKTQQFSGTNGIPVWTGTVHEGLLNGYNAAVTKQLPSTGTKGSVTGTLHSAIFGCMDQLLVGEWGAMEILTDPYTLGPQQVKISTLLLADVLLRHPQAFAAVTDIVV